MSRLLLGLLLLTTLVVLVMFLVVPSVFLVVLLELTGKLGWQFSRVAGQIFNSHECLALVLGYRLVCKFSNRRLYCLDRLFGSLVLWLTATLLWSIFTVHCIVGHRFCSCCHLRNYRFCCNLTGRLSCGLLNCVILFTATLLLLWSSLLVCWFWLNHHLRLLRLYNNLLYNSRSDVLFGSLYRLLLGFLLLRLVLLNLYGIFPCCSINLAWSIRMYAIAAMLATIHPVLLLHNCRRTTFAILHGLAIKDTINQRIPVERLDSFNSQILSNGLQIGNLLAS